jgi:predicted  nucleic acid-binding Zn-ribbon protein
MCCSSAKDCLPTDALEDELLEASSIKEKADLAALRAQVAESSRARQAAEKELEGAQDEIKRLREDVAALQKQSLLHQKL